ncbi:hypothetical protein [Tsukamurella pseudospumae]|uniref:hypothetical protein n=1 Tax=Tsukamurella pseudospumae TaxID=239498 RepID=UPI000A72100C|nr:hypothetical protein [Tsukamurella pseudospumae]
MTVPPEEPQSNRPPSGEYRPSYGAGAQRRSQDQGQRAEHGRVEESFSSKVEETPHVGRPQRKRLFVAAALVAVLALIGGVGALIYFNVQAEATDATARSSAAAASSSAAAASSSAAAAALRDRARAAAPAQIAQAARERAACAPKDSGSLSEMQANLCKLSVSEKYGTCDQSESPELTVETCVEWLIGQGKVK